MKYEFFIPGQLPGLNEIIAASKQMYGRGRLRPSKYSEMKKEWTTAICRLIQLHRLPEMERIAVSFVFIEKNRKRDKDNIEVGKKFILDALVAAGVIKNDGWKQIMSMRSDFAVDKNDPGVCVCVESEPDLQTEPKCRMCDRIKKRTP